MSVTVEQILTFAIHYIPARGIHAERNVLIGQLYATGQATIKQLAAYYGLTAVRICQILRTEESRVRVNGWRGFPV